MKETPKFYNSLDETKKEIFSLLFQGVKKRKSNFHNTVLNTVTLDNKPEARTVILRGFDTEKLIVSIHSDLRAKKIVELQKNDNVCLVFYDDQKKIQLRVRGTANIRESYENSWNKLSNWSRRCYLSTRNPGMICENPTSGFPEEFALEAPSSEKSKDGLKNFSVIQILINEIEWLFLASQGHRRAIFSVERNKSKLSVNGKWLVP